MLVPACQIWRNRFHTDFDMGLSTTKSIALTVNETKLFSYSILHDQRAQWMGYILSKTWNQTNGWTRREHLKWRNVLFVLIVNPSQFTVATCRCEVGVFAEWTERTCEYWRLTIFPWISLGIVNLLSKLIESIRRWFIAFGSHGQTCYWS